jgi:hypothetical protein
MALAMNTITPAARMGNQSARIDTMVTPPG